MIIPFNIISCKDRCVIDKTDALAGSAVLAVAAALSALALWFIREIIVEELYFEQIVERESEGKAGVVRMIVMTLSLIFLAGALMTPFGFLFPLALATAFVGFYFVVPLMYVEYEYLYMSKELTVDKIFNKERRKRVGSWDLNNMEIMALAGSDDLRSYENRQINKKNDYDFTSLTEGKNVYVIYMNDKGGTRIAFEPNDEILKTIRSQFPRQAKIFL